jgi:hypothetical protein
MKGTEELMTEVQWFYAALQKKMETTYWKQEFWKVKVWNMNPEKETFWRWKDYIL